MKKHYLLSLSLFALMAIFSISGANAQFVIDSTGIQGVQYGYSEFGDFDNDGDQDLVINGHYNTGGTDYFVTKVYRNSAGDFAEAYPGTITGVRYGMARWGDYDNDSDLDLLVVGSYGLTETRVCKLYQNTGSGFVEVYPGTFTALDRAAAAWADFNNDGKPDIAIAGTNGTTYYTKLYQNTGVGFTEVYAGSLPGMRDACLAWSDYDNDGLEDLAATGLQNSGDAKTCLFHNTGTGFVESYAGQVYHVTSGFCAWGDYNNDGFSDLLVSGSNPDTLTVSRIYMNNGSGFTLVFKDSINSMANSAGNWGDLDNDGDLDIFISGVRTGGNRKSAIFINSGTGFHQLAGTTFTNLGSGSACLGDYDNDHDLDVFYTGNSSAAVCYGLLYENQAGTANTPPAAPTGLSSNVNGNIVTLSWDKTIDAQTATDALTYNIYIGSTPGNPNACAPNANVATGWRKVAAAGSSWHGQTLDISNLAAGTYYWSVQAIDNGYEGSAFATEQSFVLTVGGMEEAPIGTCVLYPNPVSSYSVVDVEMMRPGKLSLAIYDLSGRLVQQIEGGLVETGMQRIPVDGSALAEGSYLLSIMVDGVATGKPMRMMKGN